MTPISERLRKDGRTLRFRADIGDMGRKPDPLCALRLAAADCDNAADIIDALVEAASNINLTFDSYGKERLPEYVRKEFAPLLKAIARARGAA